MIRIDISVQTILHKVRGPDILEFRVLRTRYLGTIFSECCVHISGSVCGESQIIVGPTPNLSERREKISKKLILAKKMSRTFIKASIYGRGHIQKFGAFQRCMVPEILEQTSETDKTINAMPSVPIYAALLMSVSAEAFQAQAALRARPCLVRTVLAAGFGRPKQRKPGNPAPAKVFLFVAVRSPPARRWFVCPIGLGRAPLFFLPHWLICPTPAPAKVCLFVCLTFATLLGPLAGCDEVGPWLEGRAGCQGEGEGKKSSRGGQAHLRGCSHWQTVSGESRAGPCRRRARM